MQFNLEDIYTWMASYKGLPFPVQLKSYLPYKKDQWNNRINLLTGKKSFNNLYGQPVIMPVILGGIELGSGEAGHINIQPMVMIEAAKRIVKTPIAGGTYPGTVKEFISIDDYKVRIWGAVVNPDQKTYPDDQLQILKDLWAKNEALSFNCAITDGLFDYVVIENFKLDELRMSPGIQFYEFNCTSDGVQDVERLRNE